MKITEREDHFVPRWSMQKRPRSQVKGSFRPMTDLRGKTILKSEQDKVWNDELRAVIDHYQ